MQENFTILKQRAALERPTFPISPLLFWVPETCLAAVLDCRMINGISWVLQRTFLNDYLLEKDKPLLSSETQRMWHPYALRPDLTLRELRREPQNSSIPEPCFQSGGGILNHTGGTYSHSGMIELHLPARVLLTHL